MTFDYGSSQNNTINMAASEPSRREMQLFTGFFDRIDAIIMQENTKSEPFFKKINKLYVVTDEEKAQGYTDGSGKPYATEDTKTHNIYVGKSPNYLIFKLQSQQYMYLMATCQYDQFFESSTFTCTSCRPAHHSFGLQEEMLPLQHALDVLAAVRSRACHLRAKLHKWTQQVHRCDRRHVHHYRHRRHDLLLPE